MDDWVNKRLPFRLQAISQNGLLFATRDADRERYRQLEEIAIEMAAGLSQGNLAELKELFGAAQGYATPRVDVRGAVFKDEKLFLTQSGQAKTWVLPGRWAELNVSPRENVAEYLERLTGCSARVKRLLAVWDDPSPDRGLCYPTYGIVFLCTFSQVEAVPVTAGRFFTHDEVGELCLPPAYQNRLERLFGLQRHPDSGPDLD